MPQPSDRKPQPSTRPHSPRMDIVRSMLADRDNRSASTAGSRRRGPGDAAAAERRRLWQERLAQYVREPDRH